jgi:CubicO group peptidase (beta-lactamase class C family)
MASTFGYANNGFVVAGAMLEAKLDKPWEELVRTHVFTPLKLASAGFGAPGKKGALTQPAGHAFDGKSHLAMRVGEGVSDNPEVLGPAGRIHMSFDDVLAYLAAHVDGHPFLKAATRQVLHTPPFGGDYAMGWVVRTGGDLWHNGSNTLWYAEVLLNPASGLAAVAAANEAQQSTAPAVGKALVRAAQSMR